MGNPRGVRRDFEALERRRLAADAAGGGPEGLESVRETARQAESRHSKRVSALRWLNIAGRVRPLVCAKPGAAGRKPLLDAAQRERLTALLLEGPEAHGFPTPLWTCPRVARLIGDEFGVAYHEGHVWKILRGLGWSPQRPLGRGARAQRRGDPQLAAQDLAGP